MRSIMHDTISLMAMAFLLVGLAAPASANPKLERIALQLTGDRCTAHLPQLQTALSAIHGIQAVDLTSMPDHVLIDLDLQDLPLHTLLTTVTQTLTDTGCQATPMESCISAGPVGRGTTDTHLHPLPPTTP